MEIEQLSAINIKCPFFGNTKFEIFPINSENNRVALIYGANGSGKSTIAGGFREYVNDNYQKNVEITLLNGENDINIDVEKRKEKIFVFDEEYIDQNIKIQDKGLGTIVLFGQQVEIEKHIKEKEREITEIEKLIAEKKEEKLNLENTTNINSPIYWINEIKKQLQSPENWAEIAGIKIKGNKISDRVNDYEIHRLGKLNPKKEERILKSEFDKKFKMFSTIKVDTKPINEPVEKIVYSEDLKENLNNILSFIPARPELTQREKEIYDCIGLEVVTSAKGFLSVISNKICTTCLQEISEEYRHKTLQIIEHILNRDIEEFRNKLNDLYLPVVQLEKYKVFKAINPELFSELSALLLDLNNKIEEYNKLIKHKYDNPFEYLQYMNISDLINEYDSVNEILIKFEIEREAFNKIIIEKDHVKNELLELNDFIAYYKIKEKYNKFLLQKELKDKCENELNQLNLKLNKCKEEKITLNNKRQNFNIALDKINEALEYIFYSKERLKLELSDDKVYYLKSFGNYVPPNKVSCGERNAIALCYYFTEIVQNQNIRDLYNNEILLIIDDPISSFDLENKIGILSFLKMILDKILISSSTTKIILMTHDISAFYDLGKALSEISQHCKKCSKKANFSLLQLVDKEMIFFKYKETNEYTRLLTCIYDYANDNNEGLELTIGNIIRRVLEAFSTFSYKKGIEKMSLDDEILNLLSSNKEKEYFKHLMYRLVLNGESHFENASKGTPETMFYSNLSSKEKKRIARDILCFMYKVNRLHIISHLPNAENNLKSWCKEIEN